MKQALVIGNPISHSLSPKLHKYWLENYAITGDYLAQQILPEDLEDFLLNFTASSYSGANITIPHKEAAFKILKAHNFTISKLAEQIGAVNTIYVEQGQLKATNTDYYGFKHALLRQYPEYKFAQQKILLIGAGGAARALIAGLATEDIAELNLLNRTLSKAEKLQQEFPYLKVTEFSELLAAINHADLIVNCSSCGMNGQNNLTIDFNQIKEQKLFYDIVYKPLHTKLLEDALANNHKIATGLAMLAYQAVPAFEKFFGTKPEVTAELLDILE